MKQLSQKEEKLLEQYFDGESGFFARRRAKRLLGSNQAANSYLNGLHELSNNCKEAVSASFDNLMPKLDLWNKISARIDQE
ncbi:MAG: hypothetical protein KDD56_04115, partial [Bdellovibrionales bacterium]|nr:hypothetical protein [Bdellovibrionales bacterium]